MVCVEHVPYKAEFRLASGLDLGVKYFTAPYLDSQYASVNVALPQLLMCAYSTPNFLTGKKGRFPENPGSVVFFSGDAERHEACFRRLGQKPQWKPEEEPKTQTSPQPPQRPPSVPPAAAKPPPAQGAAVAAAAAGTKRKVSEESRPAADGTKRARTATPPLPQPAAGATQAGPVAAAARPAAAGAAPAAGASAAALCVSVQKERHDFTRYFAKRTTTPELRAGLKSLTVSLCKSSKNEAGQLLVSLKK
ncbi:hypothetical protein VOLCADRAFT_87246 [Volvox carteri f. nagariensis]|uniref:Uncharacterized protein n=1 Tax=Volvox carteri f. nagariensis TaxID=3068 RepID=D8TKJ1_VOLCA|nr:uncharacterized protein VOLCADRAFT_87246 [Volvox carteri f. nagariensis]EFJ52255.1 hypothetical protein VOLCADRAFT_87246 [Volvox carteri f. nagariensis]|eukprot:XP_002947029.1 hypothetical protein VOLCADRAFT_87246 [Volvox carteri f. nagariensis]